MELYENKKGLTKKTLNGIGWSSFGTAFQVVAKFLVLIILARLLSPEDFGLVSTAMIIISFSMIFSTVGIGPALVQKTELTEMHIRVGYTMSIIFSLIITSVVWLSSNAVADFFNMEELSLIIKVLSITFFIQGFSIVGQSLLERNMNFRIIARIQVISYVLGYGLISIVVAFFGGGIWALISGQIAQVVLQTLSILYLQPHSKKINFSFVIFKELTYFGGGFTIARVFNHLALQGDNIVIGKLLGPVALGFYGRAYQLMVMPANLFGQILDKVLFPAMAQIQDDKKKLNSIFLKGTAIISLVVLPFSIFLIVFSEEIILILFGEEWKAIIVPFKFLALGMLFRASYKVSESVARATGAVYRRAWRQFVYAVAVFLGSYIGHFGGLNGVAIGITLAILINFILMTHLSISLFNGSWISFIKVHIPSLNIGIILLLEFLVLKNILNFIQIPDLLILAFVGLFALGTISVLFKFSPNIYLGSEGKWIIKVVQNHIVKYKRGSVRNGKKFS